MSIPFNVIQRGEPGVAGGGTKKFYAQALTRQTMDIDAITHRIEQISTVSGADIRAVLYALIDVIPDMLSDGHVVKMGEVGRMRISLSSTGHDKSSDVTAASVRKARIIFTPGKKLEDMLKLLTFQKESA